MVVVEEVPVFVREDVGVRDEVKVLSSKFLLHLDIIEAQPVLPRDLIRVWKMIDSLVFIQTLIKIRLAAATGPEEIPFVGFGVFEIVCFTDTTDEFCVTLQNLVQEFTVLYVIATATALMMPVGGSWWSVHKKLRPINVLELDILVDPSAAFVLACPNVLSNWRIHHLKLSILVEEVLRCTRLAVLAARNQQWDVVVFNVA